LRAEKTDGGWRIAFAPLGREQPEFDFVSDTELETVHVVAVLGPSKAAAINLARPDQDWRKRKPHAVALALRKGLIEPDPDRPAKQPFYRLTEAGQTLASATPSTVLTSAPRLQETAANRRAEHFDKINESNRLSRSSRPLPRGRMLLARDVPALLRERGPMTAAQIFAALRLKPANVDAVAESLVKLAAWKVVAPGERAVTPATVWQAAPSRVPA
jgi:hypothetical protein